MSSQTLHLRLIDAERLPNGGPLEVVLESSEALTLGRDAGADWSLPDPRRFISGRHLEFRHEDGVWWMHDVSTNGTFVNESKTRVETPYQLVSGDRLQIGHYTMAVTVLGGLGIEDAAWDSDATVVSSMTPRAPEAPPQMPAAAPDLPETSAGNVPGDMGADPDAGFDTGLDTGLDTGIDTGPDAPSPIPFSDAAMGPSADPIPESWLDDLDLPVAPQAASSDPEFPDPESPEIDFPESVPPEIATPDALEPLDQPWVSSGAPPAQQRDPQQADPVPSNPELSNPGFDPNPSPGPETSAPPAFSASDMIPPDDPAPVPQEPPPPEGMPELGAESFPDADLFADPDPDPDPDLDAGRGPGQDSSANPFAGPVSDPAPQPETVETPFESTPPVASGTVPEAPPAPPPVRRPVSAPPSDTPSAPSAKAARTLPPDAVLAAICAAAGLPSGSLSTGNQNATATEIGRALKLMAEELTALLQARAVERQTVTGGDMTMIGRGDNNPLKFMPSAEQALTIMYGPPRQGFQRGSDAVRTSFSDIRHHQSATAGAVAPALSRLLNELSPETIEAGTDRSGLLANPKARAWETFVDQWNAKTSDHDDGMVEVFMEYFSDAYDAQGKAS